MLHILGNAKLIIYCFFFFQTPHNQMFDLFPCATLTIKPPILLNEIYVTNGLQAQCT